MKKIIIVFISILAVNVEAQLKVGYNVKNIQTNTNFQVESSTGQHFVISRDSSKVGIGTLNPTTKLEVIGTIKITDGTQGVGKVLISDANGQASWQNSSAIQSSTKDSTTASNGLTLSGKDVQLGGTLSKATSITTSASNTIAINGLQSGVANDSVLIINPSTGIVKRISSVVLAAANEPWYNVATNSGASTNTQNIYQMGKVGINFNNPVEQFEVNGNIHQRGYTYFKKTTGNTHAFIWTNFTAVGDAINYSFNYHNADGTKIIPNSGYNTNSIEQRNEGISFFTSKGLNNLEPTNLAFLIRSSGRIGINTASPSTQLHIVDSTNNGPLRLEGLKSGATSDSILVSVPSTGIIRRISPIALGASIEPWFNVATNSGATSNLQDIYQLGNIGIGTASPSQQLHFGNKGNVASNKTYNGSSNDGFSLNHYVNVSTENNNTYSRVADIVVGSSTSGSAGAGVLRFLTSTNAEAGGNIVEKMRIHSNGYVGIGTNLPQNQLSVASNSSVPLLLERFQSGNLNSGLVIARSSSNTIGTHSALNNNELIGGIRFQASNGTGYPSADNARIIGITDGNQTTSNAGGSIAFFTAESGTTSTLEKMRLTHNGNLGIGTTTPVCKLMIVDDNSGGTSRAMIRNASATANSAADFLVQNNTGTNLQMGITSSSSTSGNTYTGVAGTASFLKSTAGPLYLYAGSVGVYLAQGSSSWTSNSDRRIKRDIQKFENGLSKLLTLNGYTYNYISDSEKEQRRVGLIAQEVQEVLPEAISVNSDGILGVRYTELTPLIIEAVKDLKNELDQKNKEINEQKILIDQLFKELVEIKNKLR